MNILEELEELTGYRKPATFSLESDISNIDSIVSIFDIGTEGELYSSLDMFEIEVGYENSNGKLDFSNFTGFGTEGFMDKVKGSPEAIKMFMKKLFEMIKKFFIACVNKIRGFIGYARNFFRGLLARLNKNKTSNTKVDQDVTEVEFYSLQPIFSNQYLALKDTANLIGNLNSKLNKGHTITDIVGIFTELIIINIGLSLQIDVTEPEKLNGLKPDMDYHTLKSKMDNHEFVPFFTKSLEECKAKKIKDTYLDLNTDITRTHNIITTTEGLVRNMEKVVRDLEAKIKITVDGTMAFIDTFMEDLNTDKEAASRDAIKASHGITLEELGQIKDHLQLLTILDVRKNALYNLRHQINKENLNHLEENIKILRDKKGTSMTGAITYRDDPKFLDIVKKNDVFSIKSDLEGFIATFKGDKIKIDEAIQYAIDNSDFDWEPDNGIKTPPDLKTVRDRYNYEKGMLVQNFSKERYERVLILYKEHSINERNNYINKNERNFRQLTHFMNSVKKNDVFAIKSDLEGSILFFEGNKNKIDEAVKYAMDNSDFDWEKDDGVYFGEGSRTAKEKYFYETGRLVQNFTKERYNLVIELYKRYVAIADTEDGVK